MAHNAGFGAGISEIRQRFLKRLEQNLALFSQAKIHCEGQGFTSEQKEQFRSEAHKLAGTAQMFGFDQVGSAAERFEDAILHMKSARDDAVCEAANLLVETLQKALASKGSAATQPHAAPASQTRGMAGADTGPQKILVVDDDENLRLLLKQHLHDCQVMQAEDGSTALEMLKRIQNYPILARPQLIVLDIHMPGLNGLEVLDQLKSNPQTCDIPVLIFSAQETEAAAGHAAEYIAKPCDMQMVAGRIKAILQRRHTTILIADDDASLRELLAQRFAHLGYAVCLADNGGDALAKLYKERPQLAILDVLMPDLDGMELLKRIKNDPTVSAIPIMLLTSDRGKAVSGLTGGAHDYVTKPFDMQELTARVMGILGRSQTPHAAS